MSLLYCSDVLAIEEHQIIVCNSYCSDEDKVNLAITNRYGRTSEMIVIGLQKLIKFWIQVKMAKLS